MPLVTVSHKPGYSQHLLDAMRRELPDIVSRALACDEEPYDGSLGRGDVVVRSSPDLAPDDVLDMVVEIQTTYYESRAGDLPERAADVRRGLEKLGLANFGVWVALPAASWSQD